MKTITHIRESKFENYCDFCDELESQCVCGPNEEVAANSVFWLHVLWVSNLLSIF